jgi:protein ImuA
LLQALRGLGLSAPAGRPCVSAGTPAIDEALPWGGIPCGVHEIAAAPGDAAGTAFAALLAAGRPGPVLWCRSRRTAIDAGDPYGHGLRAFGLSVDRLILIDAARPIDLLWAMEEGARTKGLSAVVGEGASLNLTAGRRLQLAAEAGKAMALILPFAPERTPEAELHPSAALTRWRVRSEASLPDSGGPGRPRWTVELRRCRGGGRPQRWIVEWNDETLSLRVAPLVADRALAAAV